MGNLDNSERREFEIARRLAASGLSLIPTKTDGSKAPAVKSWKKYQNKRSSEGELRNWFRGNQGIAVIGGKISGNLEILDFDDPKAFPEWKQLVANEDSELISRLPIVQTPTGGFHVYYRCDVPPEGNQKLAQRKGPKGRAEVKIETRGEGGYVIAPGSPPSTHTAGKPYQLLQGDLCKIPTLTAAQRSMLLDSARLLNEVLKPKKVIRGAARKAGNRPGDDFNQKAEWTEILEPHGWEAQLVRDGMTYWKRPDKQQKGISATTNYADTDLLYVFSTNADPFEAEVGYTKFAAFALLKHKGNFKAAAADLARGGFGGDLAEATSYQSTERGLEYLKSTKDGRVPVPLCNFTAKITKDIEEDDGAETRRLFEIEAKLNGRPYTLTISSAEFAGMNWVTKNLGAQAVLYAGYGAKDHTRVAIQLLSGKTPRQQVFTHTGWRKIDGKWCYLHGGGSIGSLGSVSMGEVVLNGDLSKYQLPEPPDGEELHQAIHTDLKLLEAGPAEITYPLFASIWRAVLGDIDHVIHLAGPTGTGKSVLAALIQQHFGAELDIKHLPANWSSTENSLEALAFLAKDAVLVIDDFAPSGSQYDILAWHKKADRIFRAQGNGAGRQRMRTDSSLRTVKPPRGLILSTGEDIPRMQSVRARALILELSPDDLDWNLVTECQKEAAAGTYARVLSAFLWWLAKNGLDEFRATHHQRVVELRSSLSTGDTHKRTPEILANLSSAFECFSTFALDVGAISKDTLTEHRRRLKEVVHTLTEAQVQHQDSTEPTQRFIELLVAAISSGRAHVAGLGGEAPSDPDAWGWRSGRSSGGESSCGPSQYWTAQGARIGWIEGDDLYLEPEAAFQVAQRMGQDSGEGLYIGGRTLRKRLKEKGLLKSVASNGKRLLIRRTLQGARRWVLHLDSRTLLPMEVSQVGQLSP